MRFSLWGISRHCILRVPFAVKPSILSAPSYFCCKPLQLCPFAMSRVFSSNNDDERCSSPPLSSPSPSSPVILSGRQDAYDGIILDDPEQYPSSPGEFLSALQVSLRAWRQQGRRGVWLKLPLSTADLVPAAAAAGFVFHHAEPDYVMMTQWLPNNEENKLPPSASHQVGVGAFVYDEKSSRVLVVKEKSGPLKGKDVWKVPTGLVLQGEDITEAAVREVREETGVVATFEAVLAMRQAHGFAFGKSDLFFLVALKPAAENVTSHPLVPQEDEIEDATWMLLEDYVNIPFTASRPLLAKLADLCVAWTEGKYKGLEGTKIRSGGADRQDLIFFGESEDTKSNTEDAWLGVS